MEMLFLNLRSASQITSQLLLFLQQKISAD